MAIQPRRTTSFYTTCKVFQLINQLRRRLKPRVRSERTKDRPLGSETCLGLEDDALLGIERCLPRLGRLQEKKHRQLGPNKVCKNRKGNRSALKLQALGYNDPGTSNTTEEQVQRMLKDLDGNFNPPNNALSAIAANNKLFIERNEPNFDHYSLNELIRYLCLVHDAIDVLYQARSQYDDQWLICQGNEIGLMIDEAFIANYEHLLLSLRRQLVDALLRKVIEALIEGGQDKRQRKLLNWFTEYANNHRPLNTTWPWSIKPSLAVLWGVCWMFYNGPQPYSNDNAELEDLFQSIQQTGIPQARLLDHPEFASAIGWPQPQPNEYRQFGIDALGELSQHASVAEVGGSGGGNLRQNGRGQASVGNNLSGNDHVSHNLSGRAAQPHTMRNRSVGRHTNSPFTSQDRHLGPIGGLGLPAAFSGPTEQDSLAAYNTYASTSHASPGHIAAEFSPGSSGIATHLQVYSQPFNVDNVNQAWQHNLPYAQQLSPVAGLPPHQSRRPSHLTVPVPDLRVNDEADTQGFAAPQPVNDFFSSNIYAPAAPTSPQAPHTLNTPNNLKLDTTFNFQQYNMGNTPKSPLLQQPQVMSRPRTNSNPNSNMPTPVSIEAPRSPMISPMEAQQRDRRISNASSHPSVPRQESEERSSPDLDNSGLSPRRGHAYKRSEDPPRNRDNKMVCKHKECASLTFDRKCEWSKHMDKHDRPYKCNVKGCEKLQGFTYSGGLLRHEREVHKMHGGTKKSLFCPFADCKRSSGAGFTRKENLAEHVRRVHRTASMSSTDLNTIMKMGDTQEDGEDRGPGETQEDDVELGKRKRASIMDQDQDEDLREEVKRLRRENEDMRRESEVKESRLKQLEEAVRRLQSAPEAGAMR